MELRVLGVLLVAEACAAFGFVFAARLCEEIKQFRDLISVLNYMECELNYRLTPLPKLFRAVSGVGGTLEQLFLNFASDLDDQVFPDVESCMYAAIRRSKSLSPGVKKYLHELGVTLGKFDLQGQLMGINTVRRQCNAALAELEKDNKLQMRNYQTLGLCAGAVVAIILL